MQQRGRWHSRGDRTARDTQDSPLRWTHWLAPCGSHIDLLAPFGSSPTALTEKCASLTCGRSEESASDAVVTSKLGRIERISRGSGKRLSGSNRFSELMSIVTTSASSSSYSGRVEHTSHCRIFTAMPACSSSILQSIRSYVSSSVLGNEARACRSIDRSRQFSNASNWQAAHQNLS